MPLTSSLTGHELISAYLRPKVRYLYPRRRRRRACLHAPVLHYSILPNLSRSSLSAPRRYDMIHEKPVRHLAASLALVVFS